MPFDSSTLCARTSAGEAELSTPSQGLSLGQRRVLTLIQNPIAVDELAQQHRLEPEKLARDLTRLADLRLVVLQGTALPSAPAPVPDRPIPQVETAAMAPIVIGRGTRRAFTMPLAAGAAALLLAAGIWYGTRAVPAPTEASKSTPAPTAATPTAAPVALATLPTPPASNAANAVAAEAFSPTPVAAPVAVPRQDTTPTGVRPQLRAETPGSQPAPAKIAPAPDASAPKVARQSDAAGIAATSAPLATPPVITATAAPAPAAATSPSPSPTPAAAAETQPPVLLASAAPTSAVPRPAATTAPKALSREPPDFPKEAIADGYKSGVVTARLHVDARGSVTGVDIMGSQPPKVFDRAVRRALLRWQFEPNAAGQAADLDVDVKFQRD
jgi:TonB family protein